MIEVLLVDDEVEFTRALAKVLRRRSFGVEVTGDASAALAALQRRPFDVVLLDVKMPGMDGIQALAEIMR
ncbi:MAG: response regulator, partial [Acidobacteriota bacterium]